jgi:alpha-D-xyloside xylohydrolase
MISIWSSFGPETKAYKQLDKEGLLFNIQTWPQSGLSFWPPRMDYPSGVRVYDCYSQKGAGISIGTT